MIERLLAAERSLAGGDLDAAERLYAQVAEADERNAIALVGLARVARARGDSDAARDLVERALAVDPDEAAAARLRRELGAGAAAPATAPAPAPEASPPVPEPGASVAAAPAPATAPEPAAQSPREGFLGRLLRLLRLRR